MYNSFRPLFGISAIVIFHLPSAFFSSVKEFFNTFANAEFDFLPH